MSSYIALSSQTLSSAASSVTFSSIPTTKNGKTLRDLVLVMQLEGTGNLGAYFRFNGDTGSNYNEVEAYGDGSSATSGSFASNSFLRLSPGSVSTDKTSSILQILDYAQTNKHKSCLIRTDRPAQMANMAAGRWASTSAITTLLVYASANNFATGSTFSLYGIEG